MYLGIGCDKIVADIFNGYQTGYFDIEFNIKVKMNDFSGGLPTMNLKLYDADLASDFYNYVLLQ